MDTLVNVGLLLLQELFDDFLASFSCYISDHLQKVAHKSHCCWHLDSIFWSSLDSTVLVLESFEDIIDVVEDVLIIFIATEGLDVLFVRE